MKYNDAQRIEEFKKNGTYPSIHDDIIHLVKTVQPEATLDLGASIGLLSVQLSYIMPRVIAVEGNKQDFAKALRTKRFAYLNYYVDSKTIKRLKKLIKDAEIKYVVARRVFPEIYDKGGLSLIKEIAESFYNAGIERIFLEGRVYSKQSKHFLSTADKECKALAGYYTVKKEYKNCRMLERRDLK